MQIQRLATWKRTHVHAIPKGFLLWNILNLYTDPRGTTLKVFVFWCSSWRCTLVRWSIRDTPCQTSKFQNACGSQRQLLALGFIIYFWKAHLLWEPWAHVPMPNRARKLTAVGASQLSQNNISHTDSRFRVSGVSDPAILAPPNICVFKSMHVLM